MKQISRRDFLKGAAATAGVAAVGGLFAPGLNTASAAESTIPAQWDNESDILIVGTGMGGICAAISAYQAGARSITIIDKHPEKMGGNTILSGGNMEFGGTEFQKRVGVEDTVEMFYEDCLALGDYRNNRELLRQFVDNGSDTVAWFEELGCKFRDALMARPYNRADRGHQFEGGGGDFQILIDWVLDKQIPILLGHKMVKVIRETQNSGRVLGVEVETADGIKYFKGNKAVLIASGGFKANVAMRMGWDPRLNEDIQVSGVPHVESTGEGILAVQEICGSVTDMSWVCEYRRRFGVQYYQDPSPGGLGIRDYTDVIFVNKNGERFVAETEPDDHHFYESYVLTDDANKVVWVVFGNEAVVKNEYVVGPPRLEEGYFHTADTVEELAGLIGVPADALAATVAKNNAFAAAGTDADFGKEAPQPIAEEPYHAVKMQVYAHDQGAGIRVNTKSQVIDIWGAPIEGLYAVGEATGGYFGTTRGHGKMSVHAVYGRTAGAEIAKL